MNSKLSFPHNHTFMRRLLFFILASLVLSCTEESNPEKDPSTYYFEITLDGQTYRQDFPKTKSFEESPISVSGSSAHSSVELRGFSSSECLAPPCLDPFYLNLGFSNQLGFRELEVVEMIQVPDGSFTSAMYQRSPSKVNITITKADPQKGVFQANFVGSLWKYTQGDPIKVSASGSFFAPYKLD